MSYVGKSVGPIRIVELLGAGGMGHVYRGVDRKLQRDVAVKVVRGDRLNERNKARFLREAQILSRLDHPGICKVYGFIQGGTRDFLILELIRGRDLAAVTADRPGDGEMLSIAEKVARTLAAAHARGVVHRDLKPSNVMVTDDGGVKVLDFGLARSIGSDGRVAGKDPAIAAAADTEGILDPNVTWIDGRPPSGVALAMDGTQPTAVGTITGTLAYMSPEQLRGEPVTPAADVFALGLLFQELFSGRPAYDTRLPAAELMVRVSRGETRAPEGLDREMRALIARMTAAAPEDRPSANEVATAVRHLRDRPRRRRVRMAIAAALLALILAAVQYGVDLSRERAQAVAARREAEAVAVFLESLFEDTDPRHTGSGVPDAGAILDRGIERIEALADQPDLQARLKTVFGRILPTMGRLEEAQRLAEEALAVRRRHSRADDPDLAATLLTLGRVERMRGDQAAAADHLEEAVARARRAGDRRDLAAALIEIGLLEIARGDLESAETSLEEALAIEQRAQPPDPGRLAETWTALGRLNKFAGRFPAASEALGRALALRAQALGDDHPDLVPALNELAEVLLVQNRYGPARPLLRQALEIERLAFDDRATPNQAVSQALMATTLADRGRFDDAERAFDEALDVLRRTLGPETATVGVILAELGRFHHEIGDRARAGEHLEQARAILEGEAAAPEVVVVLNVTYLAAFWIDTGHHDRAATLLDRIDAVFTASARPPLWALPRLLAVRARLEIARGEPARAIAGLRRAVALQARFAGDDDPWLASYRLALGRARLDAGDPAGARAEAERAERIVATWLEAEADSRRARALQADLLLLRGDAARADGDGARAERRWREALAILEPLLAEVPSLDHRVAAAAARARLGRGDEAGPSVRALLDAGWRQPMLVDVAQRVGVAIPPG